MASDSNFKISGSECFDKYSKYLLDHPEHPKNSKINFDLVTEILNDFGIFVRKQPSVTKKEQRMKWINERKNLLRSFIFNNS